MNKLEKVIYKSDNGMTIVFDNAGPYLLEYIDTMSVGSIADENMMLGGIYNTYVSGYDKRVIPMDIAVVSKSNSTDEYRQLKLRLSNIFNLSFSGTLIYQNGLESYYIRVRPLELPPERDYINGNARFSLTFESINTPLWKSYNEIVISMGTLIGGIEFPLLFNPYNTFGEYVNEFVVMNDTTFKIPIKFLVMGNAPKLKITNKSTGKFLKFNREIEINQQIEIDTEQKTSYIKDSNTGRVLFNANQFITIDSDYFTLERGRNEIVLEGGEGIKPLGYMFYSRLYGGV